MPSDTEEGRVPDTKVANAPMTEEQILAASVGERKPLNSTIDLVSYDPAWPEWFARLEVRIRGALGNRVLVLEHVGSTSVPGLPAKPIIDMVLAVEDSADEAAYVAPLEKHGFELRIREPDWHEPAGTVGQAKGQRSQALWKGGAMGKSDDKIVVESVNVPGYTTRVDREMYEAMKQAMWQVLPTESPGLTQTEIREAVVPHLPEELYPGGAKVGWWAKTVQLDREGKGDLIREQTKPLRWYRAA